MIVSLNEVEMIALRAARGTGCPWGLAEEAGKAARWLAARRLPWLEALLALLEQRGKSGACPLLTGAGLADLPREAIGAAGATFEDIAAPILLLPFLASVATATNRTFDIRWPDVTARIDSGCTVAGERRHLLAEAATVHVAGAAAPSAGPAAHLGGVDVDDGPWRQLEALVLPTYVPESATSRQNGAGAGAAEDA